MLETLWIWRDERVVKRLSWYLAVSTNKMPAKYLICRRIPVDVDFSASEEELWDANRRAAKIFDQIHRGIRRGEIALGDLEKPKKSLMDLKVELVNKMLRHCNFCRWNCKVDRLQGQKRGTCMLDWTSRVSSYFHHLGEELPIRGVRGSGTIFFTSCNMRCGFCVHPDTYVMTDTGPRRIEELFLEAEGAVLHGDGYVRFPREVYTYTYDGKRVKVSKVFKHFYAGDLIVIKPFYAPPINVTPAHELVVYSEEEGGIRKKKASELSIGDKLLIPRLKRESGEEVCIDVGRILESAIAELKFFVNIQPEMHELVVKLHESGLTSSEIGGRTGYHPAYVRGLISRLRRGEVGGKEKKNSLVFEDGRVRLKTEKRPGIPAKLKLDEEVAELLGYYCAEGHVSKCSDRPSSYKLVISFGKNERDLAARTKTLLEKKFDISARIVERKTTISVEVGKTSLALLFKSLCGSNSYDKKVPPHLFKAPDSVIESFTEAINVGDGCITGGYVSINTSSRELAHGLYGLYILLGHLPSYNVYKPSAEKIIESRRVKQSIIYYVKVRLSRMRDKSWREAKHVRYRFTDDYIIVPIHSISKKRYTGPVYNMEVDDKSHTYTASYIAIGNCQNGDISRDKDNGLVVDPELLAMMMWELRVEGCHNINLVGGEPTIHLHTIVEAISLLGSIQPTRDKLTYLWMMKPDALRWRRLEPSQYLYGGELNTPILWNSNMYMSGETLAILRELVDIWLPDFKFGSNTCSIKLARTPWYWETVSANHKTIYDWGEDIVIRHLVMPNHVECCTKRVLSWIAENMPGTPVNVMDQYHPDCFADPLSPEFDPRYSEIARRPTKEEILEAYRYARDLGLPFESISLEKSVFGLRP
ncbi:hypothetical protein HRbin02_01065 [Candidatus Calditenuaceae archaeon HR02]|nr:hypothetical protein HRbin02_01065 [Candidatus Calditenuaceae archaeon HR02]